MSSVGENYDSTNRVSKEGAAVEKNHGGSSTNVGGFQPRGGAPVRDPTLLRNALLGRCPPTRSHDELLLLGRCPPTRSYALIGRAANGAQFGNFGACSVKSVFGNATASPGAYIANASSVVINHHNGVGGDEPSYSTGPSHLSGTCYPVSKKIKLAPVAPVASISPEVSVALRYLGDLIGRSPDPEALLALVQEWLRRVVVVSSDTLGGEGSNANANPVNTSQTQEQPGNGVLPS